MQSAVENEAQQTKVIKFDFSHLLTCLQKYCVFFIKGRLKELLSEAMQHCRRDSLWQKLMTGVQLETDIRAKDAVSKPLDAEKLY